MMPRVADLPVAVVDARDRAGAHHPFQLEAREPGDLADRLFERDLHFGQRRDRRPQRQLLVEHVILPHIAVGEDVVAELLRVPEARAVPEHQPGMRSQHRDMVGDVAGVGRPGADVDHGDAAVAGLDQMKRRHLRHALDGNAARAAAEANVARDHIAGLDERSETGVPGGHALAAQTREKAST